MPGSGLLSKSDGPKPESKNHVLLAFPSSDCFNALLKSIKFSPQIGSLTSQARAAPHPRVPDPSSSHRRRVFRLGGVATRPAECGASGGPLGGRGCSWWAGRGRVGGASAGGRGAMLLSPPPSSPPGPAHRLRPAPPTALPEASRPAASLISGPSCAPPSVLTSGRPQGVSLQAAETVALGPPRRGSG